MKCPDCGKKGPRSDLTCYISSVCPMCGVEKWPKTQVDWRMWLQFSGKVYKLMCDQCWTDYPMNSPEPRQALLL